MEFILVLFTIFALTLTFTMISFIFFLITFLQGLALHQELDQNFKDAQKKQNDQANVNYLAFHSKMNEYEQDMDLLKLKNEKLEREITVIKLELRGQRTRGGPYSLHPALSCTPSNRSIN